MKLGRTADQSKNAAGTSRKPVFCAMLNLKTGFGPLNFVFGPGVACPVQLWPFASFHDCIHIWWFPEIGVTPNHPFSWDFP